MDKYSEVVGMPVICISNGKKIGVIKDILFHPEEKKVIAFLLERKGGQINKKFILLEDIQDLGNDAMIVSDCNCIKDTYKYKEDTEFKNEGKVKGLRVYSRTGEDYGTIEDILFDYKTGIIEGVEISDGLLQDLVQGRKMLPLFGKVEFSKENILVDKEAIEEMVSSGGGLKKKILGE